MKKDCIHYFGDKGCAILKKGTPCTGCKFYENAIRSFGIL